MRHFCVVICCILAILLLPFGNAFAGVGSDGSRSQSNALTASLEQMEVAHKRNLQTLQCADDAHGRRKVFEACMDAASVDSRVVVSDSVLSAPSVSTAPIAQLRVKKVAIDNYRNNAQPTAVSVKSETKRAATAQSVASTTTTDDQMTIDHQQTLKKIRCFEEADGRSKVFDQCINKKDVSGKNTVMSLTNNTSDNDWSAEVFKITTYGLTCKQVGCGKGKIKGQTASGAMVQANKTLACPKKFYSVHATQGTQFEIEGFDGTFMCQDTGGAIKERTHLDMYDPGAIYDGRGSTYYVRVKEIKQHQA